MTKGARIAEGRTAEVFAWSEHQILKLFRHGFHSDRAESEAARASAIHAAGLASPAVIVSTGAAAQGYINMPEISAGCCPLEL